MAHLYKELSRFSQELEKLVHHVGQSVVRVNDGSLFTASGLIWSADGVVVATSHGVERDEDLQVELADGSQLPAILVGRDADSDIAVLRVQARGLPSITKTQESEVQVGQLVVAVARPGTFGLTATIGLLSARIDTQRNGLAEHILYTDAQLAPGFSGGALVNMRGEVVGLLDRLFARGKGVALGVPIVEHTIEALLTHGSIPQAFLGVKVQEVPLSLNLQSLLGIQQEKGVLIVQIEPNSPADQAGLLPGDILLMMDKEILSEPIFLRRALRTRKAGQTVELQIARGGTLTTLSVVLGNQ